MNPHIPISEKHFQQQVIDLAKLHGWKVYHTFDSRKSEPGFPDLVLVRGEMLRFIEAKSETGRLSEAQTEWITALDAVKWIDTDVCQPRDWEYIKEILAPDTVPLSEIYGKEID